MGNEEEIFKSGVGIWVQDALGREHRLNTGVEETSRLEVFRLQGAMYNLVFFWCKVKGNDDQ